MGDEPPSLTVGTGVSAKYKGAFCEAKIRKVVRSVKCKVLFKNGLGSYTISDDQIRGTIRIGSVVELRHPEKKELSEATITKIQDCSQYTVVFDDGDITTLRRTALCLKSGKHFAESETLDQLPLTHPEHFSTPVIGGRRGRRTRVGASEASSDEDGSFHESNDLSNFKETDIGRVVCVEGAEKRKNRDNWFPALIVAPTAQESVAIRVREEYLVRSFKDGRYYTVPKKEILEFSPEMGSKAETNSLKTAVEKAIQFIDHDELPLHWDRDLLLYGVTDGGSESDGGDDNEGSDDEPREKKDHFVAQLYKFMDENGTPINEEPVIGCKDVDLFRLYKVVNNLGGYNRVCNQNNWKNVSVKLGFGPNPVIVGMVKQCYKKYLLSFEACPKRSGYAMQPRLSRSRNRVGRASVVSDRSISTVSVKFEKEKSAEKVVERVAEALAPKESAATGSKPVPLTPQKEIIPVLAKTPVLAKPQVVAKPQLITKPQLLTKPPVLVPIKEKGPNKKATPVPSPSLVPKPVNDPKTSTKEATGLKLRNLKLTKNIEVPPIAIKPEPKLEGKTETAETKEVTSPSTKDKKKRVIARIDRKDIPLIRGGKVDCLANTRQKRVIKERLKTVAESIKARTKTTALSIDGIEKSVVVKSKGKEEVAVTAKGNKKEENAAVALISDDKRKGRKRKEKSEVFDEHYDVLPTYKSISLGDKLKVYYGPTKEAKITSYEAKVLNIKEENGETLYLVHYTGWNTRYDEWIRANRIADNLSWVAGRASKKQAQASTPKHPKKERKPSKNDTKGSRDSSNSGPSSGNNALNAKETHQTRQGSVGRSTTPCSIASSSSRSRGIVMKRPSTRAAQFKKDDDLEESESDGASDTDDSKAPISSHGFNVVESNTAFSGKNKKAETVSKSEDSDSSIVAVKLEKEDNEVMEEEHQLVISSVISMECESESKEDDSEPAEVKAEIEEYIKEDDEEEDYDDENLNEDSVDERKDEKDVFGIFIEEEIKEESNDSGTVDVPLLGFDPPNTSGDNNVSVPSPANSVPSRKSSMHGSDSLPDNENGVGEHSIDIKTEEDLVVEDVEMKSEPEEITNTEEGEALEVETLIIPIIEPEDVYEFKEPEPFEFEARKSSDDRVKASKRNISIVLEDPPPSPKFKSSPVQNVTRESSPQLTLPDLAKDDTSPGSTPTIQTCEEAFDKICASPLRAATLESHHIALLDHMESYEDDDNFDDDSEDRLVISERESDNCSTGSIDKDKESNTAGHPRAAPEIIELKSTEQTNFDCKEDFTKDEDDDDEDAEDFEDEAINNAIQTAMNMETSDESSNEEIIPNEEGATSVTEIEVQKTEEIENTSELVDVGNGEINTGKEVEDGDQPENVDQVELPVADEKDASEEETKEENEVVVSSDSVVVDNSGDVAAENKEVEVSEEVEMDTADPEEDENNIESLICEETIPGSPPSQLEVLNQIEDKHMMGEDDLFKTECEIPVTTTSAETGEAKHLAPPARSPSISPGSEESSTPSPTRESDNATAPTNDKKQEKEYERNENRNVETTTFKKDCGKSSISSTETRAKKAEVKTPAKRGRKSKKKNEEGPTRKKYARHGKHQGSESDENYDWASGVNKTEASQSRSLHSFRQTFIIAAEKLSSMDPTQRINQISEAMQNLRTMYNNIKSELATIDKRRKRIKRREREDAARNNSARSH